MQRRKFLRNTSAAGITLSSIFAVTNSVQAEDKFNSAPPDNFELNEATKYISPTKTPEFLAAGKPVVSTSIHDVVHPYADKKVVSIADTPDEFAAAIEQYLSTDRSKRWLSEVDTLLETMSWDDIWKRMDELMNKTLNTKTINHENKSQAYV